MPERAYRERLERARTEESRLSRQAQRIGTLRFVCFALFVLLLGAAYQRWPRSLPAAVPLLLLLLDVALFVLLVVRHGIVENRRERQRHLMAVNQAGLARLDGSWARGPVPPGPDAGGAGPGALPSYAGDLDLSGAASLLQLCDSTHTRHGERALLAALGRAAEPEPEVATVSARQEAVRELAPLLDLRQALEVEGRVLSGAGQRGGGRPDPEPLLRWAEEQPLLTGKQPWLRRLTLLPLLTVAASLLTWLPAPPPPVVPRLLVALLLVQVAVLAYTGPRIGQILAAVASRDTALAAYAAMLTLLCDAKLQAPQNRALQERLRRGGQGPAQRMRQLQGYYGQLLLRQNPILWLPANVFLLWDLYFALRVERWQVEVGRELRGWLEALGEFEARASLAALAHDNPDWAFPEFHDGPAGLAADELGHPLIPRERRVGNDVTLPGPGRAWLVTGSNMSGKSTLLRSIGLCQVLAQAGAPVCARRARLSPLRLRTVMRVDDSLAQGMSHFYAELRRLKETVDAARGSPPAPPLCYLLDEILHGTNTRERELGARLVIKSLCRRGALGVVSTHDLSLATLEEETGGAVHNVHFTELVQDDQMTFDYRLRPGPVQTTNALRLMRLCGIDIDWE